jgi:hypothetical protein
LTDNKTTATSPISVSQNLNILDFFIPILGSLRISGETIAAARMVLSVFENEKSFAMSFQSTTNQRLQKRLA